MTFYCNLMQEIKIRDNSIGELSRSLIPAQIVYESSYLQLRMICELIALACLVAHGDIPAVATKKMQKILEADQIIRRLSDIHPDFYPRPMQESAGDTHKLLDVTDGFLTKENLIHLYTLAGGRLHRGPLKDARIKFNPNKVSLAQVQRWRNRIVKLLQHHWIKLHDCDDQIGVQMRELRQIPAWTYWGRKNSETT
jgi:hypothetical protein